MRRAFILSLAVLVCAIAVCTVSMLVLNSAVSEAEDLQSQTVLAVNEHRFAQAKSLMVELAELWHAREGILEMLVSHDALHEVDSAIAEAQICLECEDHDDFLRTMSNVRMGLEHLRDEAALRWSNLY